MNQPKMSFSCFLAALLILPLGFVSLYGISEKAQAQSYGYDPSLDHMPKTIKQRQQEARAEKERQKIHATWDDRKIAQTIAQLQDQAVKKDGACDGPCISTFRCLVTGISDEIPFDQYEYYFVHPLRPEDMSGREKELNETYQSQYKTTLSNCQKIVDMGVHRNGTIAGLELQMDTMNMLVPDNKTWLEFFRNDSAISQYDQQRVMESSGQNHAVLKEVWLRQFSVNLNGNFAVSHNRYDCTTKMVQVLQYVVYNARGKEVFGDYMPSQGIPMDLHNKKSEDYALYLRLCPAPPEPEKQK